MSTNVNLEKFANQLQDAPARERLLGKEAEGIPVCDVCIWNVMGEEGRRICGQIGEKFRVYEEGRTSCKFVIVLMQYDDRGIVVAVYTCPGTDLIEVAPLLQGGPMPDLNEDIRLNIGQDLAGLCDNIQSAVNRLKKNYDLEHFQQQLRDRQQTPNVYSMYMNK